jgi:hypothetical protein
MRTFNATISIFTYVRVALLARIVLDPAIAFIADVEVK